MDASILVSVKKVKSFLLVFVEDVNSLLRATTNTTNIEQPRILMIQQYISNKNTNDLFGYFMEIVILILIVTYFI